MSIFKCKMCGGALEIQPNATVAECEYCGTMQTLPKLDDGRKANLYDRANHFRRNNEFDKAAGIYEQILNDDGTDAETYWSLVLCRYGIEYVEDPATHKRVPTVNRAQFTSIFDDDNYKSALQYADLSQRAIYEDEAKAINEIQKGILAISQKEEPFDVFICYKESDANGRRTPDSVLATDLYHQLTQEGFKVFFSRITLEDKLGTAYEPYIFAALNSAKVMVVLGTRPEYFNAVWVKNEWSRYLALIKQGQKKLLIPAYKDMDPYDLPEEFSHLQAQDMSKLGFMQDLIRGVKKILTEDAPKAAVKETVVVSTGSANVEPLLKRAFMFLEDGDWKSANEYCEKVLDQDPENAQAYLGKLMAELGVRKQTDLKNCKAPFDGRSTYQKIARFGDDQLRKELEECNKHIRYTSAKDEKETAETEDEYKNAANAFAEISGYRDADAQKQECLQLAEEARKDAIYTEADELAASVYNRIEKLEKAVELFLAIPGWRDAGARIEACQRTIEEIKAELEAERLEQERKAELARQEAEKRAKLIKKIAAIAAAAVVACIAVVLLVTKVIIPNVKYKDAVALMEAGQYTEAIAAFEAMDGYKDSVLKIEACNTAILDGKYDNAIALMEAGQYTEAIAAFEAMDGYKDSNAMIMECKYGEIVALRETGDTVGAAMAFSSLNYKDSKVQSMTLWEEIAPRASVAAGYFHTVGLRSDGTVAAVGNNAVGQCDVDGWTDVVAVAAGNIHTVGLRSDGTVVAVGENADGQCDVDGWTDVVAVAADSIHTVGLRSDGTVVAAGSNNNGRCDVEDWTDIVAVAASNNHTVGLRSDGTVVAAGSNNNGRCDIYDWTDIVAVAASNNHTVGLRSDGTVVAVGDNEDGQCNVSGWTGIKVPD